jgi:probable HAF family extracellular repeat protein
VSTKVPGGQLHAVIWERGVVTDLAPLLGATNSNASAISDTGFIVGRADGEPFLVQGGSVTNLPTLGANGIPNDVNDHGQAVGSSWQAVGVGCTFCDGRAVLWEDGTAINLGVLAPPNEEFMTSSAHGINDLGQVVGDSTTPVLGTRHGFVWDAASGMRDLNELVPAGWFVESAYAINDHGQIAADGSFMGGVSRALLPTPLLPATYCAAGTSASGFQASIGAQGSPSATAGSGFSLNAVDVEGAKDGLFFFGTAGRQANAWGNGSSFQCVVPPVVRTGLLAGVGTPGACDGFFSHDLNAVWSASPHKNPGAGALVQAQLWYRDPQSTSNQTTSLSDAIEFLVGL